MPSQKGFYPALWTIGPRTQASSPLAFIYNLIHHHHLPHSTNHPATNRASPTNHPMRPNFTSTQVDWLRSRLPQYIKHVHRQTNPSEKTSGRKFAYNVAREFIAEWPGPLANQPHITAEDEICEKIHEWFKNNNKTPRSVPMLKPRAEPSPSAQHLFAQNDAQFKAAFQLRIKGLPTSENLPTFNRLKSEMWEKLTPDEQAPWIQQAAELREKRSEGMSDEEKQSHRSRLVDSLNQVLTSYTEQTDFSFYLLAAGPSDIPGEAPRTFRMEMTPVQGVSFQDFHPTFQASISQPWCDFADHIEAQRILKARLNTSMTTDPDGYPILPPKGRTWSISEGATILTAYLDQLWYKLHGSMSKHLQVPWQKVESDATPYLHVDDLPASCQPFKHPSHLELTDPDSIIDLWRFCTTLSSNEPSNRFPFIIQSSTERQVTLTNTQRKRQELIALRESDSCQPPVPIDINSNNSCSLSAVNHDDDDSASLQIESVLEPAPDPLNDTDLGSGSGTAILGERQDRQISNKSVAKRAEHSEPRRKTARASIVSTSSDDLDDLLGHRATSRPTPNVLDGDISSEHEHPKTSRKRKHAEMSTMANEPGHSNRGRPAGSKKQVNQTPKKGVLRRSERRQSKPVPVDENQPAQKPPGPERPKSTNQPRVPVSKRYTYEPVMT